MNSKAYLQWKLLPRFLIFLKLEFSYFLGMKRAAVIDLSEIIKALEKYHLIAEIRSKKKPISRVICSQIVYCLNLSFDERVQTASILILML